MNEVGRLLTAKESALRQIKREIDALRLTAALLAEPSDKSFTPTQVATTPEPFRATPIAVLSFTRELEARRRQEEAHRPAHIESPRRPIFPESCDGIIVCDACGHRNPEYLLDCERCDIPIRLRG